MRSETRFFAALSGALALTQFVVLGCMALPAPETLEVEEAWIRWLPADLPSAGYLRLNNKGSAPATLIGATSPAYAQVSLHRSVDVGGRMQMKPVDRITIAAHSTIDFEAGGYHMMLLQATRPLKPADRVPITLRFADGTSLLVQFEVRAPDGG
jgi:periplasmic copper chaperone A